MNNDFSLNDYAVLMLTVMLIGMPALVANWMGVQSLDPAYIARSLDR